jgi:hypothetical protein
MGRLTDTAFIGGERSDATDHCLAGIARLSNEVKDASSYLPAYDQRTYAEVNADHIYKGVTRSHIAQAIKALQEKLEETRNSFAPKPKFSFKSAPKSPSSLSLSDAAELAAEKRRGVPGYQSSGSSFANTPAFNMTPQNEAESPGQDGENPERQEGAKDGKEQTLKPDNAKSSTKQASPGRPPLYSASTVVSINNQSDTHIILPSSSLHSQAPCSLQKISGCVVDLSVPTTASAPFASLTVNNVNSSLLLCGWVLGPAHITGMKNSVLVIKCQQLRMHECENVSVYLDCASRPIIEDCTSIRFTTLPEFQVRLSIPFLSLSFGRLQIHMY